MPCNTASGLNVDVWFAEQTGMNGLKRKRGGPDALPDQQVFAYPPEVQKDRGLKVCGTYFRRAGRICICRTLRRHTHGKDLPTIAELEAADKEYIVDEVFSLLE